MRAGNTEAEATQALTNNNNNVTNNTTNNTMDQQQQQIQEAEGPTERELLSRLVALTEQNNRTSKKTQRNIEGLEI